MFIAHAEVFSYADVSIIMMLFDFISAPETCDMCCKPQPSQQAQYDMCYDKCSGSKYDFLTTSSLAKVF